MKSFNILHIFASKTWGGGEQYVYDLSKKLMEDNQRVFFIHRKSADIEKHIKPLNIISKQLPLRNCYDLFSILKTAFFIRKYHIELIHTHQFKDAFIAVLARLISRRKIKVILTRHLVKRGKTNRLYSWLYKQIDKIIFVSQLAMDEFLSSRPAIRQDKMMVIHNSISTLSKNVPENSATDYRTKSGQTLLAFVGRINQEKGIDILINALAKIKDLNFLLLIAGKGNDKYQQKLQQLVLSLGLNNKVIFTGFMEDVHQLIKQIDVGIAPSVCQESFGLSIIEFMQAGKPVITTNNGAQPEYITNHRDGILVPPSDENALAETIRILIEDENLRIKIGNQAKQTFEEKLSYPVFYKKIFEVYHEVLCE